MSKYSEKKERQRIAMMNEANRERQRTELIKDAVAKEREEEVLKAEEAMRVAAKVDVINHLVEILSLFKESESALHKAYYAIAETRFNHIDMTSFFKGIEMSSLFAIEKTNYSIVKAQSLIMLLRRQTGMPSFEVASLDVNEQQTMEEEP